MSPLGGMGKRALVLSGGGANGDYQNGALQHILGELGICYDILVGTSVGALNCGYLAQYSKGQEVEAASGLLKDVWGPIKGNGDIYQKHCYGLLWHLPVLWNNSIYTSKPLRKRVEAELDTQRVQGSGKELRVVGVSWDDGEVHTWDQTAEDLVDGILASSSFPMFFDDVFARGQWWTDGGIREVAPLKIAIEMGADQIDVILCAKDGSQTPLGEKKPGKLEKFGRFIQILLDEVTDNDVRGVHRTNQDLERGYYAEKKRRQVKVRLLRPTEDLGDALDFSRVKNQKVRALGYSDAQNLRWG